MLNPNTLQEKIKQDSITIPIPKKALAGITPVIAKVSILLSKDKIGEMFLFLVGVTPGIFIGFKWVKGKTNLFKEFDLAIFHKLQTLYLSHNLPYLSHSSF